MSERRMSDYPWTPGPWIYESTLDYEGDLHEWITCPDGETPWRCETSPGRTPRASRANHELIALTPEMAEAILKFCDTYETDQWFQDVAGKIRAIVDDHGVDQ